MDWTPTTKELLPWSGMEICTPDVKRDWSYPPRMRFPRTPLLPKRGQQVNVEA